MKLEILGTGCAKCKKLFDLTAEAVKELGIDTMPVKVDKVADIMKYNVMLTPALVINGKVKVAGRLPSKEELTGWLNREK